MQRRPWSVLATAAVVALVVGATAGCAARADEDDRRPRLAQREASTPTERLVGTGGLVIAVPSRWPLVGPCGDPVGRSYVFVEGEIAPACGGPQPDEDRVAVDIGARIDADRPGTTRRVGTARVVAVEQPFGRAGVRLTITADGADRSISLAGPRDEVMALAASLRPVPVGYVVVPDRSIEGRDDEDVAPRIAERYQRAGLEATLRDRPADRAERQQEAGRSSTGDDDTGPAVDPEPGTVLRIGSRVVLTGL